MIRKIRSATHTFNLDKAVGGNAPFELEPSGSDTTGKEKKYRRGILLTHGLSESPYFMRYLAAFFQACGFCVLAVLLPGHGTRPGDLLETSWQEWARAVAYGTDRLADEVDEVYLGGYSAGGALSIYQSLHDQRVRGLFLFAPALEITRLAAYAFLHKWVSWLIPRQKWLYVKPDIDSYRYESFAKNAATQMYQMTLPVSTQLKLHELKIPIFAVASADDKTVKTSATVEFMAQHYDPRNKLILYTTEAAKLAQNTSDEKIEWVDSVIPEQKILSNELYENEWLRGKAASKQWCPIFSGNGSQKQHNVLMHTENVFFNIENCSAAFLAELAEIKFQSADFQSIAYFEPVYMKPPNITTARNT